MATMQEKRTLKVGKLVDVKEALERYTKIPHARLGYGLGRNLSIVKPIVEELSRKLEGSPEAQKFKVERLRLLQRSVGRLMSDVEVEIEALLDKHEVREEMKALEAKEGELRDEDETVEWRRVSLALEPGFGKDDSAKDGVLRSDDRQLFLEVGIMYDPDDGPAVK